jgi:hypothetical protein
MVLQAQRRWMPDSAAQLAQLHISQRNRVGGLVEREA